MEGFLRFLICSIFFSIISRAAAVDTISPRQSIKIGETLVSSNGRFELGFFRPGSSNLYLGIWYKKPATGTVVWVANRENPLSDGEGVLVLYPKGPLAILNSTKGVIWLSNTSRSAESPVAQLLDSGNLVVKDGKPENYLWQSFDYPSDTLLPGYIATRNEAWKKLQNWVDRFLSSWRSTDDPAPGQYSARIVTRGFPQLLIEKGSKIQHRVGPWNGNGFEMLTSYVKPNLINYYA
ncbi:hypothetical protein SLA2020_298940 [Shorea laevis]